MNNRRRILAFLGLAGAPAALWSTARAQDLPMEAPYLLRCTADTSTDSYKISYYNKFLLSEGRLTTSSQPVMGVLSSALQATYAPGFSNGALPRNGDGFDFYGTYVEIDDGEQGPGATLHTHIKAAATITSGELHDPVTGEVLNGSISSPIADTSHPGVYHINASFPAQDRQLHGSFQVALLLDGKLAATFTFDISKIDIGGFARQSDAKFLAASGLHYDTVRNFIPEMPGCSPDAGYGPPACFFTTAAVETLGLSDDCWELRTLRAFRDGPLARNADGRALTERYYAEAPRLVHGVNRRHDAARQWLMAYWGYVLPCALLARLGLHRPAITHYRRLFARLERLAA